MQDQSGRVAVVTGGNSGIGYEAAEALATAGAQVVIACRNPERAQQAAERIGARDGQVSTLSLDLADLASVRGAAEELHDRHDRLDLLVNNAGVMALPYATTADGFETQLGVNHLGHFAFAGLVWDLVAAAPGARVVTVSSGAHRFGSFPKDPSADLAETMVGSEELRSSYQRWSQYGRSKLANLLFALELDRRIARSESEVLSVAAHPGWSATNLQGGAVQQVPWPFGPFARTTTAVLNRALAQGAAAGALPTLYAATVPALEGGAYIGPDGPGEVRGAPHPVDMADAARDPDLARRLWDVSEDLTGVTFLDAG